jgi:hypothetical protein
MRAKAVPARLQLLHKRGQDRYLLPQGGIFGFKQDIFIF